MYLSLYLLWPTLPSYLLPAGNIDKHRLCKMVSRSQPENVSSTRHWQHLDRYLKYSFMKGKHFWKACLDGTGS